MEVAELLSKFTPKERAELLAVFKATDETMRGRLALRKQLATDLRKAYEDHPSAASVGVPTVEMLEAALVRAETAALKKQNQTWRLADPAADLAFKEVRAALPALKKQFRNKGGRPARVDPRTLRETVNTYEEVFSALNETINVEVRERLYQTPRAARRDVTVALANDIAQVASKQGKILKIGTLRRLLSSQRMSPRGKARVLVGEFANLSTDHIRRLDRKPGKTPRKT